MFSIIRNLFATTPARPTQPARLGRLGCEALEARDCPATLAAVSATPWLNTWDYGWALVITGNPGNSNDTVIVRENHDTNTLKVIHNDAAGNMQVATFDTTKFNGLRAIGADLGGGSDTFTYELDGSDYKDSKVVYIDLGNVGSGQADTANIVLNDKQLGEKYTAAEIGRGAFAQFVITGGEGAQQVTAHVGAINGSDGLARLNLRADLGNGNDSFTAYFTGDLIGQAQAYVEVYGEDGSDTLRTFADWDVDIGQLSSLTVKLNGGAGRDELEATYRGGLDGLLTLNLRGGDGNDTIRVSTKMAPGSTGSIQGFIHGDAGDDEVTYSGPLDYLTVED